MPADAPSHLCAQCQYDRAWRIIPFRLPAGESRFGAAVLPVATAHIFDDASPGAEPTRATASCFELRICERCGFCSWYARGLDALRTLGHRLIDQGRDDLVLEDPSSKEG
jgi:hypothetical protein